MKVRLLGKVQFPSVVIILRICNSNKAEWRPIRSVIILAINKIGRPRSGSPICLITSIKKKIHLSSRVMARTVQLLKHGACCLLRLKPGQSIANQI